MKTDSDGLHPIVNTDNENTEFDVVFVHGLMGGSHSTWIYRSKKDSISFFWPKELYKKLPLAAIWSLGYQADLSHWFGEGMGIQDRSRNLVLKMLNSGLGKRPIVFVTHSLGGLEVKEIMVRSQTRGSEEWKELVSWVRGIVFCGTPHRGSHFASAANLISKYLRTHEHVKEMITGSTILDNLHDEFITWQRKGGVLVESYVENNVLFRKRKFFPFRIGLVVPRESGNPGIEGCDCHPIDADHITLVKPENDKSDIFVGVQRFIEKAINSNRVEQLRKKERLILSSGRLNQSILNLPPASGAFSGRSQQLTELNQVLSEKKRVILFGLGGVGKSQLALEFAYRNSPQYDIIWWIPSEQPILIPNELAPLAAEFGIHEKEDRRRMMNELWQELNFINKWLLIYDNASSHNDLLNFLPSSATGHIIITSLSSSWGAITPIELEVFRRDESTAFFRNRINSVDEKTIFDLSEDLGDLPLALEQASAYISETSISPSNYLQLLRDQPDQMLGSGHITTTEKTVATVWNISLQAVDKQALNLLYLFSFLSADKIPRNLLFSIVTSLPQGLREIASDSVKFNNAIANLKRYSLISATNQYLVIHRLLQRVIRTSLGPNAFEWAILTTKLIFEAFPKSPNDPKEWSQCNLLASHALVAISHMEKLGVEHFATSSLLNSVGIYFWSRCELDYGKEIFLRALELTKSQFGENHITVARCLNNLGLIYWDMVDMVDARIAHEKALKIRKNSLGENSLAVAGSLINLGAVLWDSANNEQAEENLILAFKILENNYGGCEIEMAGCLSNLGSVLTDVYKELEAARTFEKALGILNKIDEVKISSEVLNEGSEKKLELGIIAVGRAVYEPLIYGNIFKNLSNQDINSLKLIFERLFLQECKLNTSEQHGVRAIILDNFGVLLARSGLLDQGLKMSNLALKIRESLMGDKHPDLGWSLTNIGIIESELGLHDKGRIRLEEGLKIRETALGSFHPDVATNLSVLGTVLGRLTKYNEAFICLERALIIREEKLGTIHPVTKITKNNLDYVKNRRY